MFGLTPFRRDSSIARRNDDFGFRSLFDSFFDDTFLPGFFSVGHAMRADIRETDSEYIIEAELPGVKKEDIKLDMNDDVLTISVERDEQVKEERENYIRRERRRGSISRSFYVENVKHEGINAKYGDGILTVTLPKEEKAASKKRKIDIQ